MARICIDTPPYIKKFGTRNNFMIGIKVATDMRLQELIDSWNILKPKADDNWMPVQRAEMPKSSRVHWRRTI